MERGTADGHDMHVLMQALGQKAKIRIEDVDARRPAVEGTTHSRVHIAFMSDEEVQSDDDYQDIQVSSRAS